MKAALPLDAPANMAPTVVNRGRRRQRTSLAVIGFVVLALTLGALGHVAVHAKRLEVALALGDSERIHRELDEHRRHLEIELGMLKDPGKVTSRARDELGMQPPAPENIRQLGNTAASSAKGVR